jgi:hypothetical protein
MWLNSVLLGRFEVAEYLNPFTADNYSEITASARTEMDLPVGIELQY